LDLGKIRDEAFRICWGRSNLSKYVKRVASDVSGEKNFLEIPFVPGTVE